MLIPNESILLLGFCVSVLILVKTDQEMQP